MPSLRLGPLMAFLWTSASMIAFINSVVAGVGVALLVGDRLGADRTAWAMLLGGAVAVALIVAFVAYEQWRFRIFEGTRRVRAGRTEMRGDRYCGAS